MFGLWGDPRQRLSKRWRAAGARYVAAVNRYVAEGRARNWSGPEVPEPVDTRAKLAARVLDYVRAANASGDVSSLHEQFPPDYAPFLDYVKANGQSLPVVMLLDDGRVLVQVGPQGEGYFALIDDLTVTRLPDDVLGIGRSPNRSVFAVASEAGVTTHRGWEGPAIARFSWPVGNEGYPPDFQPEELIAGTPQITRLIPFDCGTKVLLVCVEGVFVLGQQTVARLLPEPDDLGEYGVDIDHGHGSLSPDGRWIACAAQMDPHFVFDAQTNKRVSEIGPLSAYPNYAIFSPDSKLLALNSCHFYGGATIGVSTDLLPGLKTQYHEMDPRLTLLQNGARVYAAVFRDDELVVGDAQGYLIAVDLNGRERWTHFIGATVGDIDVSPDGKTLAATTFAGFLSIIDMDTGAKDEFTIGTGDHRERRRWLFWKEEPTPLCW